MQLFLKLSRRIQVVLGQKKGFTLLEMVTGMAVSTILLVSIAVVMPEIQRSYVNSIELSYSRIMANNIADALKNQLAFSYVEVCDANKIVYLTEYSLTPDGRTTLNFDTVNPDIVGLVYDKNYYLGKRVKVKVEETTPEAETSYRDFKILVSVESTIGSGGAGYELERTVRQFHSR